MEFHLQKCKSKQRRKGGGWLVKPRRNFTSTDQSTCLYPGRVASAFVIDKFRAESRLYKCKSKQGELVEPFYLMGKNEMTLTGQLVSLKTERPQVLQFGDVRRNWSYRNSNKKSHKKRMVNWSNHEEILLRLTSQLVSIQVESRQLF